MLQDMRVMGLDLLRAAITHLVRREWKIHARKGGTGRNRLRGCAAAIAKVQRHPPGAVGEVNETSTIAFRRKRSRVRGRERVCPRYTIKWFGIIQRRVSSGFAACRVLVTRGWLVLLGAVHTREHRGGAIWGYGTTSPSEELGLCTVFCSHVLFRYHGTGQLRHVTAAQFGGKGEAEGLKVNEVFKIWSEPVKEVKLTGGADGGGVRTRRKGTRDGDRDQSGPFAG